MKSILSNFELFSNYLFHIIVRSNFFQYPYVNFLGQHVNYLNSLTISKKPKTVSSFKYLITVGNIERFLKLTKYLRLGVHFYAQLTQFFASFKILMFKAVSIAEFPKKKITF